MRNLGGKEERRDQRVYYVLNTRAFGKDSIDQYDDLPVSVLQLLRCRTATPFIPRAAENVSIHPKDPTSENIPRPSYCDHIDLVQRAKAAPQYVSRRNRYDVHRRAGCPTYGGNPDEKPKLERAAF